MDPVDPLSTNVYYSLKGYRETTYINLIAREMNDNHLTELQQEFFLRTSKMTKKDIEVECNGFGKNLEVSEVNFIFNDRFKDYVKGMQDRFSMYLYSAYAYHLALEQEIIRDYILNNQDIDFFYEGFKITKRNKQDIFLIMVSVICDIDKCKSLTDIVIQSKKKQGLTKIDAGVDADDETSLCACGHSITVEWSPIIYNIYTEKCLLIGSCCGYKNKIISKKEVKELKKPRLDRLAIKNKSLKARIEEFKKNKELKMKQNAFNILKQKIEERKKAERARLNTLVYLTIPAWFKHIAMDSGCKWIQDIKKWCTTTEIYEANEDLQQFKLFLP